jgi:hypothetical protein
MRSPQQRDRLDAVRIGLETGPSGENQTLQSPKKVRAPLANNGFRGSIC